MFKHWNVYVYVSDMVVVVVLCEYEYLLQDFNILFFWSSTWDELVDPIDVTQVM